MRRIIFLVLTLAAGVAVANSGVHLEEAHVNLSDKASLQRGAKMFVNYCQGCHAAGFVRYSRLMQDLGLSEELVKQNLMFGTDKIGSQMTNAMPPKEAKSWFGQVPPDLSLVGRSRGADWLYTYLNSFYINDKGRVDNLVLPGVAMPHVLWELQGWQRNVPAAQTTGEHAEGHKEINLALVEPGKLKPEEYQAVVRDIVNFLVYIGEPIQLKRKAIGVFVILYLFLMLGVFYLVKREFWRDVH